MKKAKYAKIGERVRVISRKEFIRCGYPLTLQKILHERKEEVDEMVKTVTETLNWREKQRFLGLFQITTDLSEKYSRAINSLRKAIAEKIMVDEGFGGNERKIYESPMDHFCDDPIYTVTGKRLVKTGKYEREYESNDWGGRPHSYPILENVKTHCVYHLVCDKCALTFKVIAENTERIS